MDPLAVVKHLALLNAVVLAVLFIYVGIKARRNAPIRLFSFSLLPLIAMQLGTYLFVVTGHTQLGSALIIVGILLLPATFTPFCGGLARTSRASSSKLWLTYQGSQLALLGLAIVGILTGNLIEWVTGILDQPVIIIKNSYRFLFFNNLVACGLTLYRFEVTLKGATRSQMECLKSIFVAFVGFTVYFAYMSSQILFASYISQTELLSGTAIFLIGTSILLYSLLKYPLWEVEVRVARRAVIGTLSFTALVIYLVISGVLIELIRSIRPESYNVFFPVIVFSVAAPFLLIYLSPNLKFSLQLLISNYFFRNRYDYRDLWMKFSEKSSGYLDSREMLQRVGEFIAEAMFQRQVTIWLRLPNSDTFQLEYADRLIEQIDSTRTIIQWPIISGRYEIKNLSQVKFDNQDGSYPSDSMLILDKLAVRRLVSVAKGDEVVALLGIGEDGSGKHSVEDDRLLISIGNQLAHLIVNQRLSEELLLAREWESFNRFSSFIIHDLKNLATLQSMTLENAKSMAHNPEFLADAFETFARSTDKMINLIASLSVQRGQFSLKRNPIDVLEIISSTFDDLKADQRSNVTFKTIFPHEPVLIAGDPELLKKAFTNIFLNAIQSLPQGRGVVEVSVRDAGTGMIQTGIKDNGCGISPEQLKNLFRPFQTTKKNGTGIGLCHTRSIVEVHGGHLQIDSRINEGTQVLIEFPRLQS